MYRVISVILFFIFGTLLGDNLDIGKKWIVFINNNNLDKALIKLYTRNKINIIKYLILYSLIELI